MVSDPLKIYPGYALKRASSAAMAELTPRFMEMDLRASEATVLLAIKYNPGITPSDISRMLDMATANTTPLIRRLDKRGLVERTPVNGRSHSLSLTRDGGDLAEKVLGVVEDHERRLMDKIPEELQKPFMEAIAYLWKAEEQLP
ncbi:MarR family winged helix-turn-helix transcriptional regulator [Kordiimonas marina]|uniref:MarR family winged helix-turn-helix transcriptional regulator n=1 Tax=Kordiimonas marina TaxID=2872312 RepID=UPI001FF1FA12|nr:MarR family winged helix-turn-helix transcriptional regulator [Kordiimonas marina]MCJ9427788.1 MarR family winged helix-turn-helix transcriptional regulator [Kordiimonas marina]